MGRREGSLGQGFAGPLPARMMGVKGAEASSGKPVGTHRCIACRQDRGSRDRNDGWHAVGAFILAQHGSLPVRVHGGVEVILEAPMPHCLRLSPCQRVRATGFSMGTPVFVGGRCEMGRQLVRGALQRQNSVWQRAWMGFLAYAQGVTGQAAQLGGVSATLVPNDGGYDATDCGCHRRSLFPACPIASSWKWHYYATTSTKQNTRQAVQLTPRDTDDVSGRPGQDGINT